MAILSDEAYGWIARMLNTIEGGASWPKGMTQAKAAFLVKDPRDVGNPYSYRVLLILSSIYRRWATMRLRRMAPWVAEWSAPEMYAGVAGRGAQDAWYSAAVDLEGAFVEGGAVTGGAVDIHKCFDQILRPVVYKVAEAAGMPTKVLDSYKRYQESLSIRNSVAGGLGDKDRKRTSIPQGDPFSMMMVALIMRP